MTRRALLVGNPTARSGRAQGLIDRAAVGLRARGYAVDLQPTAPGGATVGRVTAAVDALAPTVVVALGGDGTFAEVARGLMAARARVPLGLVPAGTANDTAHSLGLVDRRSASSASDALEPALDVVAAGAITRLDAGRVTALDAGGASRGEVLFFDSVGWGMHPDVLVSRNRDRDVVGQIPLLREVWRDEAVYAGALFGNWAASWVEPTKLDATVVVDGRAVRFEQLTDVIIKATAIYGGRWVLAPDSRPDDGRFELVPILGRRDMFAKLVGELAALAPLRQDLEALGVVGGTVIPGATFDLTLSRPGRPDVTCQVDGDPWLSGARYRVDVLRGAVDVLTPADFVPPWRPVSPS